MNFLLKTSILVLGPDRDISDPCPELIIISLNEHMQALHNFFDNLFIRPSLLDINFLFEKLLRIQPADNLSLHFFCLEHEGLCELQLERLVFVVVSHRIFLCVDFA